MRRPYRHRYHVVCLPKGETHHNLGVYSNDLRVLVDHANKWANERDVPHMVIDGNSVIHHAPAPCDKEELTLAELPPRRSS